MIGCYFGDVKREFLRPEFTNGTTLYFRQPGILRYRINTPDGSEYLRIECPEGLENKLLERLGGRVYP